MATRIDWVAIQEYITENDMLLFVLPRHFQQLLLTLAPMLKWRATYNRAGYDYDDWDDLLALVDGGIDELMGGIMLSDIIGYIDEIETKLDQLINKSDCCLPDGITTFFAPVPLSATPDYPYDGETYPATYAGIAMDDLADYQAHLCGAANSMIDNIIAGLETVQTQWGVGGAMFGVVAAFLSLVAGFTLVGIPVAIAIAAGSSAAIIAAGAGIAGLYSGTADDIETARNALICLALHDTPANFAAGMESLVPTLSWSTLLQYLNYNDMIASLYSGQVDGENITVTPTTENCNCEPTYDFDITYTFDTGLQNWVNTHVDHSSSAARFYYGVGFSSKLELKETTFLADTGIATNSYVKIEVADATLKRSIDATGGTPLWRLTMCGQSSNHPDITNYTELSTTPTAMQSDFSAINDPRLCNDDAGPTDFVFRCQLDNDTAPLAAVVWLYSVRLRGWVNP